jgi:hypothetical protein
MLLPDVARALAVSALCAALAAALARGEEAEEGELVPKFEEGGKVVEARRGDKVVWKAEVDFPIAGVIVDPNFWTVFPKDISSLVMYQAANGQLASKQAMRGNNYWEQLRKTAEKSVDDYLATVQEVKVTPELKARLAALVKDWASTDFATRENATAEILKAGRAATETLAEAKKSGDPEVVSRAESALEKLEGTEVVQGLANTGHMGRIVIYLKGREMARQAEGAAARKAAAEKEGKADEAARAAAEAATAKLRTEALGGLLKKMTGGAGGGPIFGFGIRMGG